MMFPPSSSSSSVPPGDPSCPVAGNGFVQASPSAAQALAADASVAPLLRVRGLEYRLPPAAQASGEGVEAQGRLLWHVAALDWAPTPASGWVHLKGDNGSGKTTLLRVLAGMQPATGGKLEWQTRDAHPVRYLHQQPYLFDTSVAGNLVLAADVERLGQFEQWLEHAKKHQVDSRLVTPREIETIVPGMSIPS
ncbi:MAG TPA: hypothetical protein DCR98_06480, partial [Cobetia sp.]|nr:hypothetical protein [Cobetia sp.]